jgi:two-component sensor histidine kinase
MRAMRPTLPIWLTGLLLLALATVAGLIVYENYNNALKEGEARALSSAHVVAAHMEWMMEASDLALRRIERSLGDRPIESNPDLVRDLSEAVADLPTGFQYSLLDQDGVTRFTSQPDELLANNGERSFFKRLRDGKELTFSRLLDNERAEKPSFIVGRRIGDGSQFRGAATITIPNESLDRFWASMGLGPNSTISVIRDDGWLVARRPIATQPVDLSTTDWFPLTRTQTTGFYHSQVSPIDGLSRIVAFWKIPGWPLIALAAIDRQEMLDQFWHNLFSDALLMVPLMAVLMLAAFWINRLLYRTAVRNEELEQALERNRFLLREIHHRVKNNLQAVLALIRLQQLPPETRDDMARRIGAMIAVHEQIYGADQYERVEVAPYITKLVHDIASSYNADVAIGLDLAPLTVDREQALPIGMIVNEVVSNSFKYAFARPSGGKLQVVLRQVNDDLCLVIRDNGPGMGSAKRGSGMGSKLITSFVKQIGGRFTNHDDGGAVFTLTVPLARPEDQAA